MNILLLMMGGKGTRFGADIPKQYVKVNDKSIYTYILKKYDEQIELDKIIIVVHSDWKKYVQEEIKSMRIKCDCEIVLGGETRSESVKNGLEVAMSLGSDQDVVLIHDATHPYVDIEGTNKIIDIVKNGHGATLGEFQFDTVYQMNSEKVIEKVVPRQKITSGASPEAFPLGKIYDIYHNSSAQELEKMTSAGAIAIANNIPMHVVEANLLNLKITHKKDMKLFESLFDYYFGEDTVGWRTIEKMYFG